MSNTPEKLDWKVSGEANEYTLMSGGNWLAMLRLNGEMLVARQKLMVCRIVACVNACAGIPTGNLEAGGVLDTVIKERDELLAALKRASESLGRFVSDEGWAQSDMDCMDNADAIISKVEAA